MCSVFTRNGVRSDERVKRRLVCCVCLFVCLFVIVCLIVFASYLLYSLPLQTFAVELREKLNEALKQIEELQEQLIKVKADLAKAKADNGNNKRKRKQDEEAFAEFQLYEEFKRQKLQQTAPFIPPPPPYPRPPPPPPSMPGLLKPIYDHTSGRTIHINTSTGKIQWDTHF